MQNKHVVEAFQVVKHHENLTLSISVRHIDQVVQIVQKLQGTILALQHMYSLFLRRRITQQISDKDPLGILVTSLPPRAPLAFPSRPKPLSPSLSNACHAGYVLAFCSGVGAGLGFFWTARRSRIRFKISPLFLRYHPRRSLATSGFSLGISNTTDVCLGCLSISIVLSANHHARSRDGAGGGNLVPMGGTPDLLPVYQTPHLTPI